ncbi:HDOD domain-containing protein [Thiohalomonas denitrificans]|uniref:HD-like signal output (HDOD) domain, no enzymatic activity n=1 Tax=Thiohalomonas denitrificans TaxID=415747 RepID=A0A1G5PZH4_9GAMM|nr:HDOD domain-containing protein [Thiohalomonas denitrificans]SCZ54620.1 HD-like signal output (HDOD) domain, no enzymatic activity [Thiohalomonas denitrificans]
MKIPKRILTYLAEKRGQYKVRVTETTGSFDETLAAAGLPGERVARAVLLVSVEKTGRSAVLAIIPADRKPDLERLSRMLKREMRIGTDAEVRKLFPGCDSRAIPPLAAPFGLRAIQDSRLNGCETVYFTSGRPGVFIRADRDTFARLQADSWRRHVISRCDRADAGVENYREAVRRRVESVTELPAMPGIASEITRLRKNPYSHASELAAVIEQDPSLSAQLIRYATSPLYGYQGKVESVEQAIVQVLGMDFVYESAFGLVLGKTFRNAKVGPVGLNAFWRHAVHTGTLTQALSNAIDYNRRPSPGVAYLAGLLHNFGFLLLGHLFPEQFKRLNRAMQESSERPLRELERETVGVSHTELGLWLMNAWDMPVEIMEAVREHHNANYHSRYSVYPNLVYVANALLKRHGIGESATTEVSDMMLERLGLNRIQAEVALATVMEDNEGLDYIAQQMAA